VQVVGAGEIAGGVNNMPEGHQIVWNLEFGICNFPRRGLRFLAGFDSDLKYNGYIQKAGGRSQSPINGARKQ
jgi:hypothetical protein